MPQPDPNTPPESIIVQQFAGLKNTVSPERLTAQELELAINVDLDDVGQPRRRRGRTLAAGGNYHSAYTAPNETVYIVKGGALGVLRPDYSFMSITPVSPAHLCYDTVGDKTYFSSETHSGIVTPDGGFDQWGQVTSEGIWFSPVVNPTATLGAVRGQLLKAPPMATSIAQLNGRFYLANENLLWVTELYNFNLVDATRNFFQFEDKITMLQAVDDGIFVGTLAGLWFLKGTFPQQRTNVAPVRVLPGSDVVVPSEQVHPGARGQPYPSGGAVMFMTDQGIFAGFSGGQCFNLTLGQVVFPDAMSAAAMYRQDAGSSAYVAVTDSGGSPTANARIGDWCDAEIVRASQG